ncbi:MAG: hypothetical protein M3450_02325 [Actinomycetota bacterium]|nr:hypothetical protein [Actinomycetota bacterium]
MTAIGFVLPLLPGKTDTDRAAMVSCWHGERRAVYEDARRRAGITREAVWIQPGPTGDVVVVYMESDDLDAAFKTVASSEEPFDRWFRDHVREVHGIALEDGFAPPEQILDFRLGDPS